MARHQAGSETRTALEAMRIIAGRLKGHPLRGPGGNGIRPTSDRLRETLFNILTHAYDDPLREARVIDLFAGTGALGFEAVSRGAKSVLFVDNGAQAPGGAARQYRRSWNSAA